MAKVTKKNIPAPKAREIQNEDQALVALYDGLMAQWKNGDPTAFRMLHDVDQKVIRAYANAHGDNVVPIFAAMRTHRAAGGAA